MSGTRSHLWPARLAAFATAALCTASAAYWVLRWDPAGQRVTAAPAVTTPSAPAAPLDAQQLAMRLGGGKTAANSPSSSPAPDLQLIGVVAARDGSGSAVIAAEGKPAKSYRVGGKVTAELVLHSVEPRKAVLSRASGNADFVTIELPARPKTGP